MAKLSQKKAKIIVVSGPSGVGKSTICRKLAERLSDIYVSVSVTTREKGRREVDGRDYWFVSMEEFDRGLAKGDFLEHAEVFGNMYGTPRGKVEEALEAGKDVILEIDVQGGKEIKRKYPEARMVFVFPPRAKILAERMRHRDRGDIESAEERLDLADDEIAAAWRYYEYMVVNDDLEHAVKEVIEIIQGNE